ncbi:MAG: methyl-accepting chemotaxis protein, partial [Bacteroidota bacterium]
EEPAERIINCLQGSGADLQVKLPIYAGEGLGTTGLILNEAISKWHSLAMEFKNASNKLNYLIEELVSGFNQLFFLEVQLREVYHEVQSSLHDQQQVGKRVDEEIQGLISGLTGLQNLPRKLSEISQEFNSLLTVNQDYLKGIADRQVEVHNESHNLIIFLRELGATSGRVDRIMQELGEIEEESEMLAFNSAISAARAGAEGQGFSVVAKEIANLVERSKRASNSLSGLIGEIQTQTDHIVGLMPKNDQVESGKIALDQIINSVFESLNENAAKCVIELDQMRQVAETIFALSSETFDEINLKLESSPVETSGLAEIQKIIDRYLESVAYTGSLKDKIQETVSNLQSATDLLISRNA